MKQFNDGNSRTVPGSAVGYVTLGQGVPGGQVVGGIVGGIVGGQVGGSGQDFPGIGKTEMKYACACTQSDSPVYCIGLLYGPEPADVLART